MWVVTWRRWNSELEDGSDLLIDEDISNWLLSSRWQTRSMLLAILEESTGHLLREVEFIEDSFSICIHNNSPSRTDQRRQDILWEIWRVRLIDVSERERRLGTWLMIPKESNWTFVMWTSSPPTARIILIPSPSACFPVAVPIEHKSAVNSANKDDPLRQAMYPPEHMITVFVATCTSSDWEFKYTTPVTCLSFVPTEEGMGRVISFTTSLMAREEESNFTFENVRSRARSCGKVMRKNWKKKKPDLQEVAPQIASPL